MINVGNQQLVKYYLLYINYINYPSIIYQLVNISLIFKKHIFSTNSGSIQSGKFVILEFSDLLILPGIPELINGFCLLKLTLKAACKNCMFHGIEIES